MFDCTPRTEARPTANLEVNSLFRNILRVGPCGSGFCPYPSHIWELQLNENKDFRYLVRKKLWIYRIAESKSEKSGRDQASAQIF